MSHFYQPVGALYHSDHSCTFRVWAPAKKTVELTIGENKEHFLPMKRDNFGYWSTTIDEVRPGSPYWFALDHELILPDPASRSQPLGVHGYSAVVPPSFSWSDSQWNGLALKDMILYELHVGTFSASGTFGGVIERLSHLKELGVTAIELMPVAQFPGDRNWGYDGVYPFATQNSYGGPVGLKELVDAAHASGIAVVLDVVYNHLGPEGNYLEAYGPYFTNRYKTFWGRAINYDDAWCDGARNFFLQNALMWLDEFHIDGLRLDAVHAIWDSSARHFIAQLAEAVRALEKSTGRKKVLIAEFDLNNPRYINHPDIGGYGLDGQWSDEYHHALHSVVTGERSGYYEDFGELNQLAKAISDSYVYTGQYSPHRKKLFGIPAPETTYSQFVVFAQNHDQVGNRLTGDRLSHHLSFEGLKLTAAAYLLAPQVPMLFMGEEYGEKNPFQYFISHTDDTLVEMVRRGRREEFAYFNWEGDIPDPQSPATFNACKLSWLSEGDQYQTRLLEFYRHMIHFRKDRLAWRGERRDTVRVFDPESQKVLAFERSFENDRVLVILNFDTSVASFRMPQDAAPPRVRIFDSAASEWLGPGELMPSTSNELEVFLQPQSVVLFEY